MIDDHTVIGRSLAVLAVVEGGDPEVVSLAEITRSTGVPKPTVRRIAERLSRHEVLTKAPGGYRLGTAAEAFGQRVAERRRERDRVRPVLLDLFATVGGAIFLSTCDDNGRIGVADVLLGRDTARLSGPSWQDVCNDPAVLLSATAPLALPQFPELLSRLRSAPPVRLTPYSPTTSRWFDGEATRGRELGYAVEHEQMRVGWSCLAVPVPGDGGRGVLSVAVPVHRLRIRPMLRELQDAAQALAGKS
jgi:DNA-binding IclR family transcriptional regulator